MNRTHSNGMKELALGAAMTLVLALAGGATAVATPAAASAAVATQAVVVTKGDVITHVQYKVSDVMVTTPYRFGDDLFGMI